MVSALCAGGILIGIIVALGIKIHFLRRSAQEICACLEEQARHETNILLDIPSRDRYMCALANVINRELRILHDRRNRYLNGDRELKEAITNISHDLRTPLTAICGYVDLLKKETRADAAQRYISVIEERAETMKRLTEELFQYSMMISSANVLPLEPVALNGVLEEAIAVQYAELCSRGITPNICMPDTAVIQNANRDALARVLGNLTTNALRYSDGDLDVVLSNDGTIAFTNTAEQLDEVQVGKLFDRFYTVESARRTTGLGLAIAKTLTEQMGGQIQASYTDKKLTLTISLGRAEIENISE